MKHLRTQSMLLRGSQWDLGGNTVTSTGGNRYLGASRMVSWLCSLWATALLGCSGPALLPVEMISAQFSLKGMCSVVESKWHQGLRMCIRKRMGSCG